VRREMPVLLRYVKLDDHVPLTHGKPIAARLGDGATSVSLRVVDETHAGTFFNRRGEVLEELNKAMG
jgi:hypothetical protein